MAVAEQEQTEQQQDDGIGKGAALKAAGAAAATGAAAFAVQKVLAQRSKGDSGDDKPKRSNGGQGSLLASAAAGGWDAARDALLPLAESAAGMAGKYVAERGPDIVKDRVVPKFIDAFNEAKD